MSAFYRNEKTLTWLLGAAGAVALHSACVAWAVMTFDPEDPEEQLGASAIEVALEFTTTRRDPTDLPAGPDAEATAASPNILEQKLVEKQTELEKGTPTDTDDPDRVVATNDSKKPKLDDPEKATMKVAPSAASVATQATATPGSQTARLSDRSAAKVVGLGESQQVVRATWQKQLIAHFDRHKRYPADRANQSADLLVKFSIDQTGHIVASEIVKGSGDAAFDAAALDMMKRSDPVPQPPALVTTSGLTFTLPVIFRVKPQT